ncbi:hypothetical protein PFISCL1PPCAC_25416, partial [Pristionchus fissidentatus]
NAMPRNHRIFMGILFVFCMIYVIIMSGVGVRNSIYERLFARSRSLNSMRLSNIQLKDVKETLYDTCTLEETPVWSDEMRRMLNPLYDPLKECNRTFKPWSELDKNGRVKLINDGESPTANCRAREISYKGEHEN